MELAPIPMFLKHNHKLSQGGSDLQHSQEGSTIKITEALMGREEVRSFSHGFYVSIKHECNLPETRGSQIVMKLGNSEDFEKEEIHIKLVSIEEYTI